MKRRISVWLLFVAALIGIPLAIYFAIEWYYDTQRLGFYGPKTELPDGTIEQHTVLPFSFTDQQGKEVTEEMLKGRVSVVNYFFVACPTICPTMNGNLKRIHDKYKEDDRVVILSHTVDPKRDSVSVLHEYSKMFAANANRWHFLTGEKKAIYRAARNSYMINTLEGDGGPTDFIHSEYLVLVDPDLHIRGYYEGTENGKVKDLMHDIEVLLNDID